MKRNDKLVIQILKLLEDSDRKSLSADHIRDTIAGEEKTKRDEVTHHLYIMGDVGYINVAERSYVRLTWQGHDQLRSKHLTTKISGLSM